MKRRIPHSYDPVQALLQTRGWFTHCRPPPSPVLLPVPNSVLLPHTPTPLAARQRSSSAHTYTSRRTPAFFFRTHLHLSPHAPPTLVSSPTTSYPSSHVRSNTTFCTARQIDRLHGCTFYRRIQGCVALRQGSPCRPSLIDVNLPSNKGTTPLHGAVAYGHPKCVELLLQAPGIKINKVDKDGRTPLAVAANLGELECLKLLLQADGIAVNKADKDGMNPLATPPTKAAPSASRCCSRTHGSTSTSPTTRGTSLCGMPASTCAQP